MTGNKTGRPTSLVAAERDTKALAKSLSQQMNVALSELSDNYAVMMHEAIDLARAGDKGMLKLLLEFPFKAASILEETADSPFAQVVETWKYERKMRGSSEESEDTRPAIVSEGRVIG